MRREPEEEYVAFVAARQSHLRRVAFALCGDWHQADDLLQTALVKLYIAWPRVHRRGSEEAYARRILVRAGIDEHRRPWRREITGLSGPEPSAEDRHHDPGPLVDALQRLPEMQRKVVVLRHWLGLSVEQTAAELGITTGTVKSHTSRGLERLREELAESATLPAE